MSAANSQHPTYDGLVMVCAPAEAKRRILELQAFVQSVMVDGVDYGVIPGTDKKRPTLLQPGAQKLAEMYGFSHRFVETAAVRDWSGGFFYFEMKTVLETRSDGRFVGEGIGSCNSKESRYAQRWVTEKNLPAGVDRSTLRREERPSRYNGGTYTAFLIVNDDPFTLVNTILKQACKRSFVHAVIAVTRSSELFTQDREDLPPEVYGVVDGERPWERGEPEPEVGQRDAKPEKPGPTPKTTPGGHVPIAMTEVEEEVIAKLSPLFATCTTLEGLKALRATAVRAGGGRNASRAYMNWYIEVVAQAQAAIGGASKPGTAKAAPAAPKSGKQVAS